MMSDVDIISEMFKPSALLISEEEYGKCHVKLLEPKAHDSYIIIRNIPFDAIIIKSDKFSSPDHIFNGSRGECKRADYIIISESKKCIIYIEMKRTSHNFQQIIQQLKGS